MTIYGPTTNDSALALARRQFNRSDNLFRAGVKIRIANLIQYEPTLDADSTFIKAVADEQRGEPLP